jgi:hypothetical protein
MISESKKLKASEPNKVSVLNEVRKAMDDKLQHFALYLSEKTRHIPPRKLAALLFMMCFGCSLTLTLNIFYSFKNKNAVQVQPFSTPVINQPPSHSMNEVVLLRIKSFHHYLDSLKKNDFLRYDSIMKSRPGLMDSIIAIEQFSNR